MQLLPYQELLDGLSRVTAWLSELGVTEFNRIRRHEANLQEVAEAYKRGTLEHLRQRMDAARLREVFWAYVESFEFIAIRKYLGGIDRSELLPVLKRAVEGPADTLAEAASNSSNAGRNYTFELAVAAMLARAGLHPHLREPDVVVDFESRRLYFSCKRPMTEAAIRERVSDAGRQLKKALQYTETDALGVVAISLSKALNPGDHWFEVATGDELRDGLADHLRRIWDRHNNSFRHLSDSRVCGAMLNLVTPAARTSQKSWGVATITHMHPFRNDRENRATLMALHDRLWESREEI